MLLAFILLGMVFCYLVLRIALLESLLIGAIISSPMLPLSFRYCVPKNWV